MKCGLIVVESGIIKGEVIELKIIHTSDWHIGKQLNGFSRIEEQKKFIDDFINIVEEKGIDIVVIAGDVYDVATPSIEAEHLFFSAMERITRNGKTIVVVSAGNHDSSDRLIASKVWGAKLGVVITGTINDFVIDSEIGDFKIINVEDGVFSIEKNGDKATFINLAYPSETRLKHKIESNEEKDYSEQYRDLIGDIIEQKSEHFNDDSFNILIGHFLMFGGKISDSEKEINIGGLDSLNSCVLTEKADYIALGHLHKKQKISGHKNCYYSGSPLQYSKTEYDSKKYIAIIDTKNKEDFEPEFVELKIHKPIEFINTNDIQNTIDYISTQENKWYYIQVEQSAIQTSDIQALRNSSDSILEIIPVMKIDKIQESAYYSNKEEKSMLENFKDYYKFVKNEEPSRDVIKVFLDIVGE